MRLEEGRNGGKVVVKDADCIRCYCCHELCPSQGLRLKGSLIVRLLSPSH